MSFLHINDVSGIDCLQWGINQFTEKSMLQYHKFMICKVHTNDFEIGLDGKFKLHPSKIIDDIWREHMLRPSSYIRYMEFLSKFNSPSSLTASSGSISFSSREVSSYPEDISRKKVRIVDYNPKNLLGSKSTFATNEQKLTLNEAWKKLFGESCTIFEDSESRQQDDEESFTEETVFSDENDSYSESESKEGSSSGDLITVITENISRKLDRYLVDEFSTCLNLKKKIVKRTGMEIGWIRLIFAGIVLEDDKTLQSYSIKHESVIHIVPLLRVC